MNNTNPNFNTWEKQNIWETNTCILLNKNKKIQDAGCFFNPSNEFENIYRHTDCFLYDCNNKEFRVDFKTVKWNSNSDGGKNSNFSINVTCFPINDNINPIDVFIFIGKNCEYAYFVSKIDIFRNEIIEAIQNNAYGDYGYFTFNKTKFENSSDYIVFKNEYIKEKSFFIL